MFASQVAWGGKPDGDVRFDGGTGDDVDGERHVVLFRESVLVHTGTL